MRGGIGEQRQDVQHLEERSRPAVRENQRQRIRPSAASVDEVDSDAVYGGAEMREGVDALFLRAPVEPRAPVLDQLLQVGEVEAVAPAGAGNLIGPASVGQSPTQVVEDSLGDRYMEGFNGHASGRMF
jgi:hypothetical protein